MPTVIIVGGPAGTGKSTTGNLLSQSLGAPFLEGDDKHPAANVQKMARGEPLNDDDRWGWLACISHEAAQQARDPSNASQTCVASCSMLKKKYREYLQAQEPEVTFLFVFLHSSYEELVERVTKRQGHFMKLDMVKSQYDIMEIPEGDELTVNGGPAIAVDNGRVLPHEVNQYIIEQLTLTGKIPAPP